MILPVLSQRTYPGVGDIDDCWCIATIWAEQDSRPGTKRPTIYEFRKYAGVPDHDGKADGGNIDRVNDGADGCWPKVPNELVKTSSWSVVRAILFSGRPCSVALDSSKLSSAHRFNFYGKHQCGIVGAGGVLYLMNPLDVEGRRLPQIAESELKAAMFALIPGDSRPYRLLAFPLPAAGVQWGWDVPDSITDVYSVGQAGTALQRAGISTYGDRINLLDLEAGMRAADIGFGTSIQLVDVTAFLKKEHVI